MHRERKLWSHREGYTFECAVESHRGVTACQCVCVCVYSAAHNTTIRKKVPYVFFFDDIWKNVIFLQREMKKKLNEGKREAMSACTDMSEKRTRQITEALEIS